jgi:hypothetical protein
MSLSFMALAILALPLVMPQEASAIPAFTRQNKTECGTCHTIFPELTEQGANFMKNSFVWVETKGAESTPKKEAKKETKSDGKEYLLLSSLPEAVPVSISGNFVASYNENETTNNKFDLSTKAVTLQAGGPFNDKMGFYAKYYLYRENKVGVDQLNAPTNEIPDLREFFIQLRHVYGTPVNVKVGRMIPELSLWKGWNKTATSDLAVNTYRVGSSPYFVDASVDAVELNTIINGKIFVAAGASKRKNSDKLEGFASISYKYGGSDFEGREAPMNLDEESFFDYLSVTLNAYVYNGATQGTPTGGGAKEVNDFYRYGFESDMSYKRWRMKLAGGLGNDEDPNYTGHKNTVKSAVFSAEALYLIGSQIIPSFRYEHEDTDRIVNRYIPVIAYAPLQNGKLVLEYKHEDIEKGSNNDVVSLGATISF